MRNQAGFRDCAVYKNVDRIIYMAIYCKSMSYKIFIYQFYSLPVLLINCHVEWQCVINELLANTFKIVQIQHIMVGLKNYRLWNEVCNILQHIYGNITVFNSSQVIYNCMENHSVRNDRFLNDGTGKKAIIVEYIFFLKNTVEIISLITFS